MRFELSPNCLSCTPPPRLSRNPDPELPLRRGNSNHSNSRSSARLENLFLSAQQIRHTSGETCSSPNYYCPNKSCHSLYILPRTALRYRRPALSTAADFRVGLRHELRPRFSTFPPYPPRSRLAYQMQDPERRSGMTLYSCSCPFPRETSCSMRDQ